MNQKIPLKKLRHSLKHGDIKRIASETNFTPNYVSMVLRGLEENNIIIQKAIELSYDHIEEDMLIKKKIAKI
jgi:DNA-binding MarR family transcriptional regulator